MTHRAIGQSFIALLSLSLAACVIDTQPGGEVVDDSSGGSEPGDGSTSTLGATDVGDDEEGASEGIVVECGADPDCGDPALACVDGLCVPAEGVLSCSPGGAPQCGNGVLETLEECDGGVDCDDQCAAFIDGFGATIPMFILDQVPRIDQGYAAIGLDPALSSVVLAPMVEPGFEVELTPIGEILAAPESITTAPDGTLYVVGSHGDNEDLRAVIVAFDDQANELWSLDLGSGTAFDVVVEESRIVVAGGIYEDFAEPEAVLWFVDPSGLSVQSPPPADMGYVSTIVAVGDELVGAAYPDVEVGTVTRWDAEGSILWTHAFGDPGEAISVNAIVPDGAGGTWSGGGTSTGPVLLHHDADGNVLERHDCLGGGAGQLRELARSDSGQLALGFTVYSNDYDILPWFAVLSGDQLTFGRTPGLVPEGFSNVEPAEPVSLRWQPDGSLLTVSTSFNMAGSTWEELGVP